MSIGRRTLAGLLAAASVTVALVGAQVAAAQQGEQIEGSDDVALLARLDALEPSLPADPLLTEVTLDEEQAWGELVGDLVAARATLDTLEPDLRRLYVDADEAATPVGAAVADVARGWLDLRAGAGQLAVWESHDLAYPLDAADDVEVATDADELRGAAEVGLRSVLSARQRHLGGYGALRDLGAAEPDAQVRLDVRATAAEDFDRELRPDLLHLLSDRTSQVLVPTERFHSTAPGEEARSRSMTVTCIERGTYTDALDPAADQAAIVAALGALVGRSPERADCPDLPPNLEVRPVG